MGCFQTRLLYYSLLYALLLGLVGRQPLSYALHPKGFAGRRCPGWTIPPLDQGSVYFFSQVLHQVSASFWSSDVFCENLL